jgi:hypothetical protein
MIGLFDGLVAWRRAAKRAAGRRAQVSDDLDDEVSPVAAEWPEEAPPARAARARVVRV